MPFLAPQNNPSTGDGSPAIMLAEDVTTARLIVGKRHCRVLTLGNINSDATGFYITKNLF